MKHRRYGKIFFSRISDGIVLYAALQASRLAVFTADHAVSPVGVRLRAGVINRGVYLVDVENAALGDEPRTANNVYNRKSSTGVAGGFSYAGIALEY